MPYTYCNWHLIAADFTHTSTAVLKLLTLPVFLLCNCQQTEALHPLNGKFVSQLNFC